MVNILHRSLVEVKAANEEPLRGEKLLALRHWLKTEQSAPVALEPIFMTARDAEALIDMLRLSIVRMRSTSGPVSVDATRTLHKGS
jgi:hypothetical protein